jgi:hypothetical protein
MNKFHEGQRIRSVAIAGPAIVAVLLLSVLVPAAQRQTANAADAIQADIDISGPFLQHLTRDPHSPASSWRCGEPQIAQDITHPKVLVVDCMSETINYQNPMSNPLWALEDMTKSSSHFHQPCYAFISRDGGNHWQEIRPRPLSDDIVNFCADPLAARGPHGELYLAGDGVHFPVSRQYGPVTVTPDQIPLEMVGIVFTRSLNRGKSWSRLGRIPTGDDRPWWVVDASTGVIYEVSGCIGITTIGEYGCTPRSRNLAVSTDGGANWMPSVDIFNQQPPTRTLTPGRLHDIGISGPIAAARGVFATAGFSGSRPGRTALFKYSTDQGATFTERPIPLGEDSANCASPHIAGLAADPTHRGGFAIIALCTPSTQLLVFITRDLGASWTNIADLAVVPPPGYVTDPSRAQVSPSNAELSTLISVTPTAFDINRPWIAYSPTGALGVLWRENYGFQPPSGGPDPLGPQDVFVAMSADGGSRFSKSVRVNTAAAPSRDPRQFLGDDISDLILGKHYAFAVWGDWRSGELETWFRKVPIPAQ